MMALPAPECQKAFIRWFPVIQNSARSQLTPPDPFESNQLPPERRRFSLSQTIRRSPELPLTECSRQLSALHCPGWRTTAPGDLCCGREDCDEQRWRSISFPLKQVPDDSSLTDPLLQPACQAEHTLHERLFFCSNQHW